MGRDGRSRALCREAAGLADARPRRRWRGGAAPDHRPRLAGTHARPPGLCAPRRRAGRDLHGGRRQESRRARLAHHRHDLRPGDQR